MSMLAFSPWFPIQAPVEVRDFVLLPFERGSLPAGRGTTDQQIIDEVLSPYFETSRRLVSRATVLKVGNHELLDDLNEEERNAAFVFSELVTVSGLARREFFGMGVFYCNSDNFRLIIQSFSELGKGTVVTSRRRDGHTLNYLPKDAFRETQPHHISASFRDRVDHSLLETLVTARDGKGFDRFYDALVAFNLANTDAERFRDEIEAVLMIGAFQRLLECRTGNENDLAKAVVSRLRPDRNLSPSDCTMIEEDTGLSTRYSRYTTLREVWIRDFYRVRGNLAHGKLTHGLKAVWSIHEHLLLAAFLFPRLLKVCLEEEGLYSLTKDDHSDINTFERLAAERLFVEPVGEDENHSYPWDRVREKVMWEEVSREIMEKLNFSSEGGGDS